MPDDTEIAGSAFFFPQDNTYWWCRHPEGSRFLAKYEQGFWWTTGLACSIAVTKDMIITQIQPPEN